MESVHVGDVLVVVEFKDGPQADGSDYEGRCQATSMNQLQWLREKRPPETYCTLATGRETKVKMRNDVAPTEVKTMNKVMSKK